MGGGGQIQVPDAEPGWKVVHLLVVEWSTIHDKIRRENEKGRREKWNAEKKIFALEVFKTKIKAENGKD